MARTELAMGLLGQYRRLCEAVGYARGQGVQLAPEALAELARLEVLIGGRLGDGAPPAEPAPPAPLAAEPEPGRPRSVAATVFCDGACQGNPGPGGYAAIVRCAGWPDREIAGGEPHATNNQMELTAAIAGLEAAIECGATDIDIVADSEYLIKGITQWLPGWQRKGWQTSSGSPVKNRELWERLAALGRGRAVRWQWTRGHAGHPENERCDQLAVDAADEARRRV